MSDMSIDLHGGAGGVNPTPESIKALFAAHGDGPVQMINLLKFKEVADYPAPATQHRPELTSGLDSPRRSSKRAASPSWSSCKPLTRKLTQ